MNADDIMREVEAMTGKKNWESLDELNAALRAYSERENAKPQARFEGLSSGQVFRLMYFAFERTDDIVSFNQAADPELVRRAPFVFRSIMLLGEIGQAGNVKATQTGALPRKMVVALHEQFGGDMTYPPRTELESRFVHVPRLALQLAGWIKLRKKTFSATAAGRKVIEGGFQIADYMHLLQVYARKYNWAYMTHLSEADFCQMTCLYSLRMLMRGGSEFMPAESLADRLIAAFPAAVQPQPGDEERPAYWSREKALRSAFSWQMLESFAGGFGLADIRYEPETGHLRNVLVRPSALARQLIVCHV